MVAPASRFSNTIETGMRVSLNTQAPLTLPGMLSTAGHCNQSSVAILNSCSLSSVKDIRASVTVVATDRSLTRRAKRSRGSAPQIRLLRGGDHADSHAIERSHAF